MKQSYTRENLVIQLTRKTEELGRTPLLAEIDADPAMASGATFKRLFGSYGAACKAAGLSSNSLSCDSKETLISQLQRKAKELGRTPSLSEINSDKTMASPSTLFRFFGSYVNACKEAGLKRNKAMFTGCGITREDLIVQLQRKAKELGRTPTSTEVKKDSSMASLSTFTRVFYGSYTDACKKAGLEPNTAGQAAKSKK